MPDAANFDTLVPDPLFRAEVGNISRMTQHRNDTNPPPKWPLRIMQGDRGFRWRSAIEAYKAHLFRAARAAQRRPADRRPQPAQFATKEVAERRARRVREAIAEKRAATEN
jgi:hypothetical protein